jgi:hypothetical protein
MALLRRTSRRFSQRRARNTTVRKISNQVGPRFVAHAVEASKE